MSGNTTATRTQQIGPLDEQGRRRSPRRMDFEVRVDLRSEHNFFTGQSVNISAGGLFISTDARHPIGEELSIKLALGRGQPSEYPVVVRWHRELDATSEAPAGMGVQFVGLRDREREEIDRFLRAFEKDTLFYELEEEEEDDLVFD